MDKLIAIAVTLGFLAVSSGQLPRALKKLRVAQIKLIQESQASGWPKAITLPSPK
jgi:hypothetical protein